MINKLKVKNSTTIIIIVIGILAVVGIMSACAPQQIVRLPVSTWGDNYFYSYEPPEKNAPGSVKITMAIVSPYFSEKATIDPIYSKAAKGLAKSMAMDLDKIIIAKGMTITGPFENLDMMTYPDKKNANLTLTPIILINTQSRDILGWSNREDGGLIKTVEVKIDGWVALEMREPLSSEKLWIKKIEVGEMSESTEIIAEKVPVYRRRGDFIPIGYNAGRILYDGRPDAMSNMMKKMYPAIMQTCWKYIDAEEVLVLDEKAKEIRSLKRY